MIVFIELQMDIITLFTAIIKNWKTIVLVTIISTLFAYSLTSFLPASYKSSAQISTGFTIEDNLDFVESAGGYFGVETRFNNLIHIIQSQPVIYSLAYQLILHDLKDEMPFHQVDESRSIVNDDDINWLVANFQNKLDSMSTLSKNYIEDGIMDSVLDLHNYSIEQIQEDLLVWRSAGTDYIVIEFTSDSPQLSAFSVNTIVKELLRYNRILLLEQNEETITFYEVLVKNAKSKLDSLGSQLEIIKRQNQIFDLNTTNENNLDQLSLSQSNKNQIESEIQALSLQINEIDQRISGLRQKKNIVKNDRILELKKLISLLNEQYINTGMNKDWLLDSINVLRKEYAEEISRIPNGIISQSNLETLARLENKNFELETDLIIAKSKLEDINVQIQGTQVKIGNITRKKPMLNELVQEIDLTTQEYLNLQDRLNDIRNQALVSGYNLRQTMFGEPSDKPEGSKKVAFILLGFLSGFAISTFTIITIALIDQSLKDRDRFLHLTGLNLLGVLTKIKLKNYDVSILFSGKPTKDKQLEFFKQSLRNFRLDITKMDYKTILISSTEDQEGKSFFILALAYSLSLINKKVLIIDTNLKNSTLTKVLLSEQMKKNIKNKLINSDIQNLSSNQEEFSITNSNYFDKFIQSTYKNGIDIIGSVPGANSPFEFLIEKQFDSFVDKIANKYDYILMEGPALNVYSDTKELIDYCDGVISIFPATKSLSKLDKESIKFYKELGKKHIGSILGFAQLEELK